MEQHNNKAANLLADLSAMLQGPTSADGTTRRGSGMNNDSVLAMPIDKVSTKVEVPQVIESPKKPASEDGVDNVMALKALTTAMLKLGQKVELKISESMEQQTLAMNALSSSVEEKLAGLESTLKDVYRSVQVLKDKQELFEAQQELARATTKKDEKPEKKVEDSSSKKEVEQTETAEKNTPNAQTGYQQSNYAPSVQHVDQQQQRPPNNYDSPNNHVAPPPQFSPSPHSAPQPQTQPQPQVQSQPQPYVYGANQGMQYSQGAAPVPKPLVAPGTSDAPYGGPSYGGPPYAGGQAQSGQMNYSQMQPLPAPVLPPPPPAHQPGNYGGQNASQNRPRPPSDQSQPVSSSRVPIERVVEDVAAMGFTKDAVRAVIRHLTESGQSVDLNIVLDQLMNGHNRLGNNREHGWNPRS